MCEDGSECTDCLRKIIDKLDGKGTSYWAMRQLSEGKSVKLEYKAGFTRVYHPRGYWGPQFSGNQVHHFSDDDVQAKTWELYE